MAETTVKQHDAASRAKELADLAKTSDAELLKGCEKTQLATAPNVDAHDREILEGADRACAAHDGPAMRRAFTVMITGIGPTNCEISTTVWNDLEVFEQIDANTWIENQGPAGICNLSHTLTLARQPGDSIWTFAMTETSPGNSPDPFCKNVHSSVSRWSVLQSQFFSRTGCKYVH